MKRGLVMSLALAALVACDDDDPVAPQVGTLEVVVETTGEDIDPDGYTVDLNDGAETEDVETSDEVSFEVDAGSHSVELTGIADNCAVDGDNPVTVTVDDDETETVTFDVTCDAEGGGEGEG